MRGDAAPVIRDSRKADEAGTTMATMSTAPGRTGPNATSVAGLTGWTAITFPQGLGDDPRQPFFMSFVPKKILSAVGGTMGDMSFQSV